MTECDECGTDVAHVWRHRAFETEGHRDLRWVCPTCHPELPGDLTVEIEETDETAETPTTAEGSSGGTAPEIRSDGGLPGGTAAATTTAADATPTPTLTTTSDPARFACPICSGETVNGQGMYDCAECGWTGPR